MRLPLSLPPFPLSKLYIEKNGQQCASPTLGLKKAWQRCPSLTLGQEKSMQYAAPTLHRKINVQQPLPI
jgi:hypothetical protein